MSYAPRLLFSSVIALCKLAALVQTPLHQPVPEAFAVNLFLLSGGQELLSVQQFGESLLCFALFPENQIVLCRVC